MNAVEFITELTASPVLTTPQEIAAQLPKTGTARIIVLTEDVIDDPQWRLAAYQQFLRDDVPEDASYDGCH